MLIWGGVFVSKRHTAVFKVHTLAWKLLLFCNSALGVVQQGAIYTLCLTLDLSRSRDRLKLMTPVTLLGDKRIPVGPTLSRTRFVPYVVLSLCMTLSARCSISLLGICLLVVTRVLRLPFLISLTVTQKRFRLCLMVQSRIRPLREICVTTWVLCLKCL